MAYYCGQPKPLFLAVNDTTIASMESNPQTEQTATERKHSRYSYEYSLDVVTDGSEATEPTVFLSVVRRSAENGDGEEACDGTILPRYAILGLSEMTARLVADQKLSWTTTKAVFCHNNHIIPQKDSSSSSSVSGGGLWGLPGILLALCQAGAPELAVVTGNEGDASRTEAMVKELHKRNPQVLIAAVPLQDTSTTAIGWWKMYEDEYLVVHATCPSRPEHLIYLFTCRKHNSIGNYTIAVLPSPASRQQFLDIWKLPQNRVVFETEDQNESQTHLSIQALFTVGVDPKEEKQNNFLANARAAFPGIPVLACCPRIKDDGILMRARNLSESWNKVLPNNIICRPLSSSLRHSDSKPSSTTCTDHHPNGILYLSSCSSVRCSQPPKLVDRKQAVLQRIRHTDPSVEDAKSVQSFFQSLDENARTPATSSSQPDDNEIDIDCDGSEPDDNEINIDGSDEDEHANPSVALSRIVSRLDAPHLLILGTGCAAPSPDRGSSGYGLLFPQQIKYRSPQALPPQEALLLTAIIECGEGTLSMLLRHLPSTETAENDMERLDLHLRHVKFLWISHAHYDHYGGLPSVVSAIYQSRSKYNELNSTREPNTNKRLRLEESASPLWIIAPTFVLKYLDLALRCQVGVKRCSGAPPVRMFHGFTHEQHKSWWAALASIQIPRVRYSTHKMTAAGSGLGDSFAYRPFAFWNNVRVDHSCFCAFGFVMGIRIPGEIFAGDSCGATFNQNQMDTPVVTFAYSGDTRPCWRLVQQCRLDCRAFGNGRLDYLLHEASFDDEEQAMSLAKKHSSLSEALEVASDSNTLNVILTHFSQRYACYPPMKLPATKSQKVAGSQDRPVVFALDGMLIPIK